MTPFTLTLALALATELVPAWRTDRFGDPLPPGAVQRLGTRRHRSGWPFLSRIYLPDGRTLLVHAGREVRWFDAESGRVLWETDTGQSIGGGVVAYLAGGRELIGIAAGMRSPTWPGGALESRIVVYGLR